MPKRALLVYKCLFKKFINKELEKYFMVEADYGKISQIYDYLRAVETQGLTKADGAFVFGRADPRIADRTYTLFRNELIDYAMISGGIGKDSGALERLELPEAEYLAARLRWTHGVQDDKLLVESFASNGGENSRFGIQNILNSGRAHDNLIMVAHSTSLRRLWASHLVEAEKMGFEANYQLRGSEYDFDPRNLNDRNEAVTELIRLAVWPEKKWSKEQEDLPLDLGEYAKDYLKDQLEEVAQIKMNFEELLSGGSYRIKESPGRLDIYIDLISR